MGPIFAAAMFVSASPTAMRPDAGALTTAIFERSPIAIASPATEWNPRVVTATFEIGVW